MTSTLLYFYQITNLVYGCNTRRYMHYKDVQRSLSEKDESFVDAYSVAGKVTYTNFHIT